MHGTLVGTNAIGVSRFHDKSTSTIVQHYACLGAHDAAAEPFEEGIYKTNGVSILINDT